MATNEQINFWQGDFGKAYTLRNSRSQQDWDQFHLDTWGITKIDMYKQFIPHLLKDSRILEVGSNTGMQLAGLQRLGFKQLYGIEIQADAVELSKKHVEYANIINASGFDIPYKDNYFDMVFTSGVLIHIAPENLKAIMTEMVRCSRKYILGFEYYAKELQNINYRGNEGFLWKADYCQLFLNYFPQLSLVKKEFYKYISDSNVDAMYLLEKK
jgi:pseudaminic acid biosynthesis-associated methylase